MIVFGKHYKTYTDADSVLRRKKHDSIMKLVKRVNDGYQVADAVIYLAKLAHVYCTMIDEYTDEGPREGLRGNGLSLRELSVKGDNADVLLKSYAEAVFVLVAENSRNITVEVMDYEPCTRFRIAVRVNGYNNTCAVGNGREYQMLNEDDLNNMGKRMRGYVVNTGHDNIDRSNYCHECFGFADCQATVSETSPFHEGYCAACAERVGVGACELTGRVTIRKHSSQYDVSLFGEDTVTMRIANAIINSRESTFKYMDGTTCALGYCDYHNRYEVIRCENQNDTYSSDTLERHYTYLRGEGSVCEAGIERMKQEGKIVVCDLCGKVTVSHSSVNDVDGAELHICEECYERWSDSQQSYLANQSYVMSYSFKPLPLFVTDEGSASYVETPGNMFMGIELELDNGYNRNSTAQRVHDMTQGLIYCKSDCSLSDGIEMVTQPMSPQYAVSDFEWGEILEYVHGTQCYKAETSCGLHVHINRSFFGTKGSMQREVGEARLIYLFDKFYDQFRKLGNRTDDGKAERWAAPNRIRLLEDEDVDVVKAAKQACNGRYHAVNQQNKHTMEVRLWAATHDEQTLRNILDLTQAVGHVARECKMVRLIEMDFEGFCEELVKYAQRPSCLRRYIEEKRGE